MPYIYLLVNEVNKKKYVGKADDVKKRWSSHKHSAKSGDDRYLYRAIRKYGIENFSLTILEECDKEKWGEREMEWVSLLTPEYNLTLGGEGGDTFVLQSPQARQKRLKKMSRVARKSMRQESVRKQLSDTAKRLRREGVYDNEEYRNKLSLGVTRAFKDPNVKRRHSKALKKAIATKLDLWSECKRGSKNGRWLGYLYLYAPDGSLAKRYESLTECAKETKMAAYRILEKVKSCEAMKRGSYKGCSFKLEK